MNKPPNKLYKFIKKVLRLLLLALVILIVLPLLFIGSLYFEPVQNKVVSIAAKYASEYIGSEISIGGLYIQPFTTLKLDQVLIRDFRNDTLIYCDAALVNFLNFNQKATELNLSFIRVDKGLFNLKVYEGDTLNNMQHFVNAFPSSSEDSSSIIVTIKGRNVSLNRLRFKYNDENVPHAGAGRIDFRHLDIKGISGSFSDIIIVNDSVEANIHRLQFEEQSGFVIRHFDAHASVSANRIICENLELETNTGLVQGFYKMTSNGWGNYIEFLTNVELEADLKDSDIRFDDIAFFTPELKGLLTPMKFTGSVWGSISDLRADIDLVEFAETGQLTGKVKVKGLPEVSSTLIDADIKHLYASMNDIAYVNIPMGNEYKPLDLPDQLNALQYIDFSGNFMGFVNDFVTYGNLKTALGFIDADINIKTQDEFQYSGKVATTGFQLGKLLDAGSTLGDIALRLAVDGSGLELKTLDIDAKGEVYRFEVLGYNYEDISINGNFSNKIFNGFVNTKDTNIALDFAGMIDLNGEIPQVSSTCNISRLRLSKLNLVPVDTFGVASGKMDLKLEGATLRELHGKLTLTQARYSNAKDSIFMDSVVLTDELIKDGHHIAVRSDLFNAQITGSTSLYDLPFAVMKVAHHYMPAYFDKLEMADADTTQAFDFEIEVKNDAGMISLVSKDLKIKQALKVSGRLNTVGNSFLLNSDTTNWSIGSAHFVRNSIEIYPAHNDLIVKTNADAIKLSDNFMLENFVGKADVRHDSVVTSFNWFNETELSDSGLVNLTLYRTTDIPWNVMLNYLNVRIAGVQWASLKKAQLHADSNQLSIKDLELASETGKISCSGKLTQDEKSTLKLIVKDLNLNYLSNFGIMKQDVQGMFQGHVDLYYKNEAILVNAEVEMDSLIVDGFDIGSVIGNTKYNGISEAVELDLNLSYRGNERFKIVGDYYPTRHENQLDLESSFQGFEISTLEPFIAEYASQLDGEIDGSVSITGMLSQPDLAGGLELRDFYGKVNYLNTYYSMPIGRIQVELDMLALDNAVIIDENGGKATATFQAFHNYFQEFSYDLFVQAENFQCLNTTLVNNEDYYGEANLTGDINIGGYIGHTRIELDATTDKGTKLAIPLAGGGDVGEFDYIRFVDADGFKVKHKEKTLAEETNGLELDLRLAVDEDAEVQIIFDEKVGDIIKVRGRGDMLMEIDNRGKFNMYGDYVIGSGDYLFTLQNIINKKFTVEPGGKIVWNGDPLNALIDINAIYKLKASPAPMMAAMTGDTAAYYKNRLPVNVNLYMKGALTSPEIDFGVNLPSLSESDNANQLLNPAIASRELRTSQAFSLLLTNHFSAGNGNVALGGSGQTTGFEMLSNQVSNWASQYSDKLDFGINYRAANGDVAGSQTDISVSRELLHDKLLVELNGSVQGASGDNNTSNLAGEFNVEYKINKDGSLKARFYNESNNYSAANLNQSPYTQGVGLFYRKEFDTWGQFFKGIFSFKRKQNTGDEKSGKKDESPRPMEIAPDSEPEPDW